MTAKVFEALNGMRWTPSKDAFSLKPAAGAALHGLINAPKLIRTARAWVYKGQLRELLDRKQINVMCDSLKHWFVCVMRSRVEAMKQVAGLVPRHTVGIVAWAQSRQTNGFLEAINSLFREILKYQVLQTKINRWTPAAWLARQIHGSPPPPPLPARREAESEGRTKRRPLVVANARHARDFGAVDEQQASHVGCVRRLLYVLAP